MVSGEEDIYSQTVARGGYVAMSTQSGEKSYCSTTEVLVKGLKQKYKNTGY